MGSPDPSPLPQHHHLTCVFTLKHNSLTNLGGNLSDHCQRKDMDNAPASQQIKQHYNQTQQAEKFTTKHTFSAANRRNFFGGFSANRNFFGGFMATLQNSASRLKFGSLGLLLSCYVLPIRVSTLCIAIAFCMWVHEMRIQASSAERDIGIV